MASGLLTYDRAKKEISRLSANVMAMKMVFSLLESGYHFILGERRMCKRVRESVTGLILTLKPPVNQSANDKER